MPAVAADSPRREERHQVRRSALLVTAIAFAFALVGCSSETPGDARAGDDGGDASVPAFPEDPSTGETTSEPDEEEAGTADLEPCDLLEAQDLTALGLPSENDQQDIGPARGCQWQASGSHTVTIGVIDELGIGEVQSQTTPEPKTVGGHDAVQYTGGAGVCAVAIAVSDSSRVDVSGVAGGDMTRACQVANQAAELVEPKLP